MSIKEHIGYAIDSTLITKKYINRKIDLKSSNISYIPKIYLNIENQSLDKSLQNISNRNKEYFDATINYPDGTIKKIKYRVRGANIWHWDKEKPSIRIKTKKKFPINLHRHLNFVSPEDILMIANPFGEELARNFGLLSQNTQMVDLYINNKYRGVYQLLNREDESFLRYNKRFPGPIYNGDKLSKKWIAKDFNIYGDTLILNSIRPLEILTEIINSEISDKNLNKLWNIIDKNKLASFSALMTVTAGTHSNYHHNQNFYFDPTLGKIEPLISDMNILGLLLKPGGKYRFIDDEVNELDIYSKKNGLPYFSIPIYEKITPILDFALSDPSFVYLRNKIIFESLVDYASLKNQSILLDKMINKIFNSVMNDSNKGALVNSFSGYYRFPYSNKDFINEIKTAKHFIKKRNEFLINQLNDITVSIQKTDVIDNEVYFKIIVKGDSGVLLNINNFFDINELSIKNKKGYVNFKSEKLLLLSNLIKTYNEDIQINELKRNLLGDIRYKEYTFKNYPKSYQFKTSIKNFDILIKNKEKILYNSITGSKVNFNSLEYNNSHKNIHTINLKLNFLKKNEQIIIGPGIVNINKNLYINENQVLIIKPGTDIVLNNNVSIFSRGKVLAIGEFSNPITINALNEKWGVFAVVGEKTKGSIFKYVNMSGGSIDNIDNIKFSGMFSLNHVPYAEIYKVKLENNYLGDDTMRVISSNIKIKGIEVNNCNGDCIDFDYSKGEIFDIKMTNSGNDGLDFMTSNFKIKNFTIDKCGDKGISIGENSNIDGFDININKCDIGIASKDRSLGKFNKVFISNSKIGLTTYVKNWRYKLPGLLDYNKIKFKNNKNDKIFEDENNLHLNEKKYFKKLYW